jgi:serine/threonine-protein kinase
MEDFCRQRGIKFVMGDLKPKHCILLPDGTVRFVDFGFAGFRRFATEGGMEVGRIYGTVRYMAPEMFKGYYAYLPQADMYSLGVIWYRMHNGRFPFSAVDAQGLCYEMEHNPFPVSDFPEQFRSLGVSLVNEDPMQRPVSFKVIVKEVDRFIKNSDETPVLLQVLMQGWR